MTLPTRAMLSLEQPSASRLRSASADGVRSRSATASVTTRFTSSGMVQSPDRRPASMWPTKIPILAATRLAARVLLTSPTTSTARGRRSVKKRSSPTITAPVCSAWLPEPTPRSITGRGRPSSSKKTRDMASS
jgi:hypothetical protein